MCPHGYSVLIVGGGPAGLATAIELARHRIAVLVVERSAYDDLRIGEHLSPAGHLQLRALDLGSHLKLEDHVASAGVAAYWGSDTASHMDYFIYPGQRGLNLSRPRFDADLARACEAFGATVLRSASVVRALRESGHWVVDIDVGGKTRTVAASLIVDATGRAATFSRRQGARVCAHDRQVAVVAFEENVDERTDSRSIVEAVEKGWWYCAPISPGRRIYMFVTDDDLLPQGARISLDAWWRDQFSRAARLPRPCQDRGNSRRLVVRSARSQQLDVSCGPGWLAVGDAAMAFDPLTSQGIAKAFDQATRVASHIAAFLQGDAGSLLVFTHELRREYATYRATRAAYYRLETRWLRSPFWERRREASDGPAKPKRGIVSAPRLG